MVERIDKYDEEMFLEYVEGQLSQEKRLEFEQHMLGDARLRNLVAQMVLDRHRLRSMPDEEPPAHLMEVVNERLERAMLLGAAPQDFSANHRPGRGRLGWGRFIAVAAVAAMFTAVAGVFVVTLVQLANDTPIQSTGTAALVPPSSLGPAQLVPGNVTPPYEQQPPRLVIPPDRSSEGDTSPATTPDHVIPPATNTGQPSQFATTEPDTTTAVDPTAQAQAKILPKADVIWFVRAADVPAVQRRLTAWAGAYEATILDTRPLTVRVPASLLAQTQADTDAASRTMQTPSIPPSDAAAGTTPSLPGANEPLSIDQTNETPASNDAATSLLDRTLGLVEQIESIQQREAPTERQALSLTLRMNSQAAAHLQTFLEALPDVSIHQQAPEETTEAAVGEDFFRAWLADDALLPAWLRKSAPSQQDGPNLSADEAITPLRLPLIERAPPEAPAMPKEPTSSTGQAADAQVIRLLLIQS